MTQNKCIRLLVLSPHYPPPVVGGLEKQAHLLNRSIQSELASIQVLSNHHGAAPQPRVEEVDGIPVQRTSWMRGTRVGLAWDLIAVLAHLIRHRKAYDVVHIQNLSTYACVAAAVCRSVGLPALIKLPNVGRMGIPGLQRGFGGTLRIACLRKAAGFVAMSEASVQELKAICVPDAKIFKMVNGIDLEAFDQAASHPAAPVLPSSSDRTDETVRFIFTGRLMRQKGLIDLVQAWASFRTNYPTKCAELWIVGRGPEDGAVREEIRRLGLETSVHLLGFQEDIPALLKRADVFVLPSYSEGNSNAILEAMAASLPVTSTDVGGSALLVGEAGRAFISQPGDVVALEQALKDLAADGDLRRRLGVAMRQRVEAHFDIAVVASAYHACYQELARSLKHADLRPLGSELFTVVTNTAK